MTASGRTFNVTIRIEKYSTPAEQKALIEAFNKGGAAVAAATAAASSSSRRRPIGLRVKA
jgi:hypothetical protein